MNKLFLEKAKQLTPSLFKKSMKPTDTIKFISADNANLDRIERRRNREVVPKEIFAGDSLILDFGEHLVGYLSFRISSPMQFIDAPVRLKLKFAETLYEMDYDFSEYSGGLCNSWLQEEIITIDYASLVKLPRRYAFRYLKAEVLSTRRGIVLSNFKVTAVTSADLNKFTALPETADAELIEIDRICAATLKDCMQTVYEDGPKRDRRLWIGDFRLQALTDYYLFKNIDLVKRCLYLFAAGHKKGRFLPSCLYEKPKIIYDNIRLIDYALLYAVTLCDYYEYTQDEVLAKELLEVAADQIDLALEILDGDDIVTEQEGWYCFIDWNSELKFITALQGVLIYTISRMRELTKGLGESKMSDFYGSKLEILRRKSREKLYNQDKKAFINDYDDNQYSVAAQVWMVLADVVTGDEAADVLKACLNSKAALMPVTPYMYNYLLEAMVKSGLKIEAEDLILDYWGSMVTKGADTFWEVYSPEQPMLSPYGNIVMNSYCHAWSCTPSYFIRRHLI